MRIEKTKTLSKLLFNEYVDGKGIKRLTVSFLNNTIVFKLEHFTETKYTKGYRETLYHTYEEAVNEWNRDEPDNLAP